MSSAVSDAEVEPLWESIPDECGVRLRDCVACPYRQVCNDSGFGTLDCDELYEEV